MKWYQKQRSIEDIQLIAWHHMLNNATLSTYTFDGGREQRTWVNPKLVWKQSIDNLSDAFNSMANTIRESLFGPLSDLADSMKNFSQSFYQAGLHDLLPDEDVVE